MEGVGCISWVIYEAVSSIVTLREGHPEPGVNVFHELSAIVHCLDYSLNTLTYLQTRRDFHSTEKQQKKYFSMA